MKTTSEYIYETLFINGENSDISIDALGKKYNVIFVGFCIIVSKESICSTGNFFWRLSLNFSLFNLATLYFSICHIVPLLISRWFS